MTNLDGRYGFKAVQYDTRYQRERSVDASTATAIFKGDLVKADTDGNASVMSAASDDFIGVVLGVFNSAGKEVQSLDASTAGSVLLCEDPQAIYQVQFEGGGTAPTSAAIFDAADAIWTHAGDTNNGLAGVELSETLAGDGAAKQFRILQLVNRADNVWGHNAEVLVTPLEHAYITTPNAI